MATNVFSRTGLPTVSAEESRFRTVWRAFDATAIGVGTTTMGEYRGRFRGTPASVRFARAAVVDYARACGFETPALADIALAAGEALANAVEHGNKDLGFIEVRCAFGGDTITIEIGDAGGGFDVSQVAERPRDPSAVRGFGISIMHAVMDEVRYSRHGAVVRLAKRLAAPSEIEIEREEA